MQWALSLSLSCHKWALLASNAFWLYLGYYIYSTLQHLSDTQFRYLKWKILLTNRLLILYHWHNKFIAVCWTDLPTILLKSIMPTPTIYERPHLLCNLQARSMLIHLFYEIVFYQNNGSMGRGRHYVGTCSGTYHVIQHKSRDPVQITWYGASSG